MTRPLPLPSLPGLPGLLRRERSRAEAYADAVMELLRAEFRDMHDPIEAGVVRRRVAAHYMDPSPTFEAIVDSPLAGNWRLCPDRDVPGHVRLADYAITRISSPHEREARVNAALAQLS